MSTVSDFRTLAERHIEKTFERFPMRGSTEGREEFNAELETPDERLFEAHEKALRKTLEKIEALPEHDFAGNDWLDRRGFLSELRTELWQLEDRRHRNNPDTWANAALESVYGLVIRHADDLTPVADAVYARLKKLPDYLDSAQTLLERPVPLWQGLAATTCAGAPSLLDAVAPALIRALEKSPKKAERVAGIVDSAKRAFAGYARAVKRMKPGKEGGFAVGRRRFEALMRERLGWDLTVEEAQAMGRAFSERIKAEMETEARKFSPTKSAEEVLSDAAAAWQVEGTLVEAYERETRRVAAACEEAGIVSVPPGQTLIVKAVPEFLRHHIPTAAYSNPGAFHKDQLGIFWVNDLSQYKDTPEEKRAEIQQHFNLSLTCAHEAYPGHHLQFCTANRHPSPIRRLLRHSIFYEGWTLWCEQMMVDFKLDKSPTARLGQLSDALWRAQRILVDCGLQTGEMTYADGVKQLVKHAHTTKARAEADCNWYSTSPTVPMSYLLGRTELLRVKVKKVDQGGWTIRQFNDWILSFGTLPWRWMELSGL
jgi:uncharacterized protein (DUF885 family)